MCATRPGLWHHSGQVIFTRSYVSASFALKVPSEDSSKHLKSVRESVFDIL